MKRSRLTMMVVLLVLVTLVLAACGGGAQPTAAPAAPTEAAATAAPAVEPTEAEAEPTATEEAEAEPTATEEAEAEPTATEEAEDEEATATPEATTAEATEVPVPENLEEAMEGGLVIWAHAGIAPILQEVAASFGEEFGVPVAVQQVAFGELRDQFKVAAPAGEGPDIIFGAHDWIGELVINGLLQPVNLGDLEEQFVPVTLQACSYDGDLYCLPTQFENVALVRNTELVPEAPETWEEVQAACEELGTEVEACFAYQQGDPYHFFGIQSAFGGSVFGQTDEGSFDPEQVEIDSEGSVAAGQFLAQLVEEGVVKAGVDGATAEGLFDAGDAAFIITGPWALDRMTEAGVPFEISALPAGTEPGRPFLGVQGFMVSAFSEDAALAEAFLTEYLATEDVMTELVSSEMSRRPSAFTPVLEGQESDEELQGFIAAGTEGSPMPNIPEMSSVWTAWGTALTLIQTGEEEPEAAMQNAAEQIRTAIEGSE